MSGDLRECPFCGGEPASISRLGRIPFVECSKCAIEISGATEARAITAWNTRTDTNSDLLEALERCTDSLEAELHARYPVEAEGHWPYPVMKRRYERDMQDVFDARTAIAKYRALIEEQGL